MKKIINLLRSIYRYYTYLISLVKGYYWSFMASHMPIWNARSEMKRQKQLNLIRPVNLQNPIYFQEKMLWLKYYLYNKSPIVAQCYNKFEVRKFVEKKGLAKILNKLYFYSDSINDIPWQNLPEECVIKLSNGYYGHVFKKKNEKFDIEAAKELLRQTERRCKYAFRISGDLFAYKTRPVYICEKLLHSSDGGGLPEDYKIHCFNGHPTFLEYIHDRDYSNKNKFFSSSFIDIRNNTDRYDLEGEASPYDKIVYPKSFDRMLEYASILSKDFPYVRVDFYEDCGNPVFGELTFTPYHCQTRTSQRELGDLLDLKNIDYYRQLLLTEN